MPRKRIAHKGFEAKLQLRADAAQQAGKLPPCTCWSCLRDDGLTPPLGLRAKYPDRYPFSEFGEDLGGEPTATRSKRSEEHGIAGGSEGSNLREAVRNRSVI